MSRLAFARSVVLFVLLFSRSAWSQVTQLGPLIPDAKTALATADRAGISDLLFSAPLLSSSERHDLGPLSAAERQNLASPGADATGARALKVGVERAAPAGLGFEIGVDAMEFEGSRKVGGGLLEKAGGIVSWTTAIRSENASGLRLRLEGSLPPSARAYIYGATGEVHGPYSERELNGESFWTNTVYAEEVFLEVQLLIPAEAARANIRLASIAHIESPLFSVSRSGSQITPDGLECFIDVTCVPTSEFEPIATAGRAMAQLAFMKNGSAFVCSGGLLNNTRSDGTPYFLTANHCFDNQAVASTLEATWNYKTTSCEDPDVTPNRALFPRSLGSTLLATNTSSDFTFLRLSQGPPANAVFLGWDALTNYAQAAGTKLYRVHHPQGATQFYARHAVVTTSGTCSGQPRDNFIYMTDEIGGAAGGSSGSPIMLADLAVVGQLRGACGANVEDDCDRANRTVDGAFRTTFPSIQTFLAPTVTATPCVANSTTACLLNGRFKATVRYRGAFDNNAADTDALVKPVTGFSNPAFETAFFYFNNANNIEMLVKMLDQGNVDSSGRATIAVLFGSATPLRIELTITDSTNGAIRQYRSDFPQSKGGADFTAFVK